MTLRLLRPLGGAVLVSAAIMAGSLIRSAVDVAALDVHDVPPCPAVDLRGDVQWQGAAGSRIATITLRYTGSATCRLAGPASIAIYDGERRLDVPVLDAGDQDPALRTGARGIMVQPGQPVIVSARWSNYCDAVSGAPLTVAVTLPEGGGRVVPLAQPGNELIQPPPCNGPAGTSVSVTRFYLEDDFARVLRLYFDAISRGDYATAWAMHTPSWQAQQSYEAFIAGYRTTAQVWVAVVASYVEASDPPRSAFVMVRLAGEHADGNVTRYAGYYTLVRGADGRVLLDGGLIEQTE